MTDSGLGAWLRQQREARGWAKAEMARRLVQAGRDNGDAAVPSTSGMLHNIHRWEHEGASPNATGSTTAAPSASPQPSSVPGRRDTRTPG